MDKRVSTCQGCLLGLAVGDAMGQPVDDKSWEEIREDYGPNGLLGYDLVNGYATGSAYTQVAAYVANGLLLSITRGKPELYLRYIGLALREWARAQHFPRDPEKSYCWVAKIPQMRGKKSKDSRMLDALRLETLGTPEKPINRACSTGSLPGAVIAGLACNEKTDSRAIAPRLGGQIVALTHGSSDAFLSGSVLTELIAAIAENPDAPLCDIILQAVSAAEKAWEDCDQAPAFFQKLHRVLEDASFGSPDPQAYMQQLCCDRAEECLAGALYACVTFPEDFDSAMILAVNHSGRSAAVGSLVGAILGAYLGAEALPEFYLESLEPQALLQELSQDLALGSPTFGLFDDDWDHKYVQGLPVHS